jgi:hypothetical protein
VHNINFIRDAIKSILKNKLSDEFRLFLENTNLNSNQIIEMIEKDYSVWWKINEKSADVWSALLKNAMIDSLKTTME